MVDKEAITQLWVEWTCFWSVTISDLVVWAYLILTAAIHLLSLMLTKTRTLTLTTDATQNSAKLRNPPFLSLDQLSICTWIKNTTPIDTLVQLLLSLIKFPKKATQTVVSSITCSSRIHLSFASLISLQKR